MLNPHGIKDIRAIHFDNMDRFDEVKKRLEDAEQGKLVRADKDNVYNNLLFSFCEQLKSYVDTMEYNSKTEHYLNSQLYVDNDLEVRSMMRALLSETIEKMREINDKYRGQEYQPFDKDIIRLGDAIANNNSQSMQQCLVDMYGTIKRMDQACENCQQELRQRFEAEAKLFNKTYRDKSTLTRDTDDYRNFLRSIADTKLMFEHILQPALTALENEATNGKGYQPDQFKLSRENQEKFDDLVKTVNDRVDYIGKHEKSHYYSTDLTPDGYLYNRSHVVESGAGKMEYQQQKTLFDRHLHEKQTELGFNTFIKVNLPTDNPDLKCEVSIPIPNAIDERKIVLTKNKEARDAVRQLLQFHEAYKSGADIGESLAKYVMNIPEQGYIPDDLSFKDVAKNLMSSLKGFANDTTVRFHGTKDGKDIDETVKLPTAIVYASKNEHLVNLKITIDDHMRDKKEYASDWINSKKDVEKEMKLDSLKNIGKNGLGAAIDYVKMRAMIYAGQAEQALTKFTESITSRTKDVLKDLLKTHQTVRDLENGGQIPLDKLTTLSEQAERTNDKYAEAMFNKEMMAGLEEHQKGNALEMESVGLQSPFDNAQVRELEDNRIEFTFFEDRFDAQEQQPMFDGHIDINADGVSHVTTDNAEINNDEIEEDLALDR